MMTILAMVALVLLLVVVGFVVYFLTRYIPIVSNLFLDVTVKTRSGEDAEVPGETVRFKTGDGVGLVGTLTPGAPGAPVVVFCHEFSSSRRAASRYARFLMDAGVRVFTFDFRGHGDSENPGEYVSRLWPTKAEVMDAQAAIEYVRSRPETVGSPVGFLGVSRGGSVALCAAARDSRIRAVVTDGAYSSYRTLRDYIYKWVSIFVRARWMYAYSPEFLYQFVTWVAMKFSELRMRGRVVSVDRAVKRMKVPVLMVHGERDNYLSLDHVRYLAGLNERQVQLWVVPEANHNEAVDLAPEEYRARLTEFFLTHLTGEKSTVAPDPWKRTTATA